MSLVISLRVPDGIVVAADSLSTAQNILNVVARDEKSGKEIELPPIPFPFSASSYTQKLFSILDKYALCTFGQGIINNKSIFYHVKEFENSIEKLKNKPKNLTQVLNRFTKYIESELLCQFPNYKKEAPDNWLPIGFHLNGYEKKNNRLIGVTYVAFIGNKNRINKKEGIGCTFGGEGKVVQKFWEIGKENPKLQFKYNLFSLQDAIDFSKFLIQSTSTFQRFANEVSIVGGEIDIALLTPFHGFQWIKRKSLMKKLEESINEKNPTKTRK